MTDLPLIPFPSSDLVPYSGSGGGSDSFQRPSRDRQRERLRTRFSGLDRLSTPEGLSELRADPGSIAPERAIVFELSDTGSVTEVYRALKNVPGFEMVGHDEIDAPPEHGFAKLNNKREATQRLLRHKLYFAMPSKEALDELLRLWRRYDANEPFSRKHTPNQTAWRTVFDNLHTVRPWGPADRLPPSVVEAWREDLIAFPEQRYSIEIELWYRVNPDTRRDASKAVRARIEDAGGTVVDEQEIADIFYHAILAQLPASVVLALTATPSAGLSAVDEVMFLRTQTTSRVRLADLAEATSAGAGDAIDVDGQEIIAAVLDGVPVANHGRLAGRIEIDDPHDFAAKYGRVDEMQHGTAMVSLVLDGDGHAPTPVRHRLHVVPVTVPDGDCERLPKDRLAVHVVYEALTRMLVGVKADDGTTSVPPSAPRVRIVTLCLGDEKRRFAGIVSPWARLLDVMAYRHRVLFLVSAGNIPDAIEIAELESYSLLETCSDEERTQVFLSAVFDGKAHRALLSPAEAINVVTVGARHHDHAPPSPTRAPGVAPYHLSSLPNPTSALGTGANRSAKPDVLFSGGRERWRMASSRDPVRISVIDRSTAQFGISAATPGVRGELDRMRNVTGTSPAAALATNAVLRIEEQLRALSELDVPEDMLAVVLKVLLAHGTAWDNVAADALTALAKQRGYDQWPHQRIEVSRFLGNGVPDVSRVLANTQQRGLAVGFGTVTKGKAAPFRVPLPTTLNGRAEWRGLTATVAWLTPIHCRHNAYRHATLDLVLDGLGKEGSALGVKKQKRQPHDDLGERGTIIHRRWDGIDPAVFSDGQALEFKVGCRSPTDGLTTEVPYAIAVTLEVGVGSEIDVFTELEAGIRAGVPVRVRPGESGS